MIQAFWNAKIIVFIDCLHKGHTINGECYANLLRQLQMVTKTKQQGKLMKRALFLQENTAAHKSYSVNPHNKNYNYNSAWVLKVKKFTLLIENLGLCFAHSKQISSQSQDVCPTATLNYDMHICT